MSGSASPYSEVSLPPGSEYLYVELQAEKPGLNRDAALWRVATFKRAGTRFFMAECCTGGTVWVEGDIHPSYEVIHKAREALDRTTTAPDSQSVHHPFKLRTVTKCVTQGCPNGQPLTVSEKHDKRNECLTCKKRYVEACVFCGRPDPAHYMWPTRDEMLDQSLCFSCHHWVKLLHKNRDSIRVKGVHYMLGPTQPGTPGSPHQGFGGQKFQIRFFDDRPDVTTYNLYCQGEIPDWFRGWLPDNACFLSEEEAARIHRKHWLSGLEVQDRKEEA